MRYTRLALRESEPRRLGGGRKHLSISLARGLAEREQDVDLFKDAGSAYEHAVSALVAQQLHVFFQLLAHELQQSFQPRQDHIQGVLQQMVLSLKSGASFEQ